MKIKDIVENKRLRFFTSEWNSNGTADLIICDDDNQIIAYIQEQLFAPRLSTTALGETFGHEYYEVDGEWISFVDPEEEPELVSHSNQVYPLSLESVLETLSESPVHSRLFQLRRLIEAVKEVS